MFRDRLSGSRSILIGLVFFVLVVGGSLLHSWHVHRTTDAEVAETHRKIQPLKNDKESSTTADTTDTSTVDAEHADTDLEADDSQMSNDMGVSPIDETPETLDMTDALSPDDFVSEEAPAEDVPVSPHGFGPYPEIPADYPHLESWDQIADDEDPEWELMARVMIKLWKQGENVIAASMENGLVYPTFTDTLYIKWDEFSGPDGPVRYISEVTGDPEAAMRLEDITENRDEYESLSEADLPSDITFVPYSEGGINPYTFLDLPTK